MRKIWAIVRREFLERVRKRWFWVMALLRPLFFSTVFVLPILLGRGAVSRIVAVDGTTTGETAAQSFSLAYFMGIILYTAILLYGINVMSSVLEEKTTRIVEVLVSSVRPFQLLLGKVLGVGAVSIFQFLIWAVSARLLLAVRPRLLSGSGTRDVDQAFQMPHVSGATALVFIIYFLGGFFLYSAMFAAVGAISSSEQEARQAQQPVAWLLVLSFICSTFALPADPSSAFAIALSLVPFSAPIAMPARWPAGDWPAGPIALSLPIPLAPISALPRIAPPIYREGVLITSKRHTLRELARWVRAA